MRNGPTLSDRCHGRWFGILTSLGIDARILNKKNQPCPICKKGRDRFRWTNHNDDGGYFCSACGHGDGIAFVEVMLGLDFKGAAERVEVIVGRVDLDTAPKRSEGSHLAAMRAVWGLGRNVTHDDPAGLYLASRGLLVDQYPKCLRFVPSLRHEVGSAPAMIAQVLSPEGRAVNIQRQWLTPDGQKAPFEGNRRIMAGTVPDGSAVRLAPVDRVMGIAEGIVTSFGARQRFDVPVWSVLSEGGMQKFRPPAGIDELIIFADNDLNFVGQAAALVAARDIGRWAEREERQINIRVEIPPKLGTDWADGLETLEAKAA